MPAFAAPRKVLLDIRLDRIHIHSPTFEQLRHDGRSCGVYHLGAQRRRVRKIERKRERAFRRPQAYPEAGITAVIVLGGIEHEAEFFALGTMAIEQPFLSLDRLQFHFPELRLEFTEQFEWVSGTYRDIV